jgi:hypothetical protein
MKTGLKACLGLAAALTATGSTAQERAKPKDLGVLPTILTAGLFDPNGKVPVVNGISGSAVSTLSVAFPQTVLGHGKFYVYLLAQQNTSFTGTCTSSYTLTQIQGKATVTLDSGVLKKDFDCMAGSVYAWGLTGKAIPNSPGLATLTGTISFEGKKVTTKVTVRIV